MTANSDTFSGEIVVASRIVDYLSSGLYDSPAACLKELINNSYDADATSVDVFVKPDADRIIVADDGHGMNREDFERHFKRISESFKRQNSDVTDAGRPKIGKIGIGFIAANEICDVMEIFSTKEGSTDLLHVSIDFAVMREDPEDRRKGEEGGEFAKADYEGEVLGTEAEGHFTQIFLKQVRGNTRKVLAGARARGHVAGKRSLYGLSASSIKRVLSDPGLKTWADFDDYSQTILQVALNVPVPYYNDWLPPDLMSEVADFYKEVNSLNFTLHIDGTQIFKPIVFAPQADNALISRFEFKGKHVAAKGYFYGQNRTIAPEELQGMLIRIRNAAIGGYDHSFLNFSPREGPLIQRWISAEVWANDGLEDAMIINRREFNVAEPAYQELQGAVHEHLSQFIKEVRARLYGAGSRARKQQRVRTTVSAISQLADEVVAPDAPEVAAEIKQSWARIAREDKGDTRVLRKFTVPELYRITLEVAQEVLTPEQRRKFVERLTTRLSR
jgi:hypothetical protein